MVPLLNTNCPIVTLKESPIQNLSEFLYPRDLSLSASSLIFGWESRRAKIDPLLLHSSSASIQVVLVSTMRYSVAAIKPRMSGKKKETETES